MDFDEMKEGGAVGVLVEEGKEAPEGEELEEPTAEDFIPETQPVVVLGKEEIVDSEQLRKRVVELRDGIGTNYTELCKHLYTIQQKRVYESWGYQTFREYASKELEFKASKAMYLAQIWKNLHENQDPKVFNKVIELGWSKAKELSRVATKENVDEWVDKAKHLGVDALVKEVRTEISKKISDDPVEALENESEVIGTPMENEKKHLGLDFEYNDYMALMKTSEKIQTEMPDTPIAAVIGMACADFLGSSDDTETGFNFALSQMKRLASVHGKEIIVIDKESGDVVDGFDVLSRIVEEASQGPEDEHGAVPESTKTDEVKEEELDTLEGVFNDG